MNTDAHRWKKAQRISFFHLCSSVPHLWLIPLLHRCKSVPHRWLNLHTPSVGTVYPLWPLGAKVLRRPHSRCARDECEIAADYGNTASTLARMSSTSRWAASV